MKTQRLALPCAPRTLLIDIKSDMFSGSRLCPLAKR